MAIWQSQREEQGPLSDLEKAKVRGMMRVEAYYHHVWTHDPRFSSLFRYDGRRAAGAGYEGNLGGGVGNLIHLGLFGGHLRAILGPFEGYLGAI